MIEWQTAQTVVEVLPGFADIDFADIAGGRLMLEVLSSSSSTSFSSYGSSTSRAPE
jgi:hypothetical protein